MTKHRQPTAFMRRSRIVEGAQQFAELSEPQKGEAATEIVKSWAVVEDVRQEIQRTIKEKGVRGRVEIWRNRKWLKANGITGNVKGMQRALDSYQAGRDWKEEFKEEREDHERRQARAIIARREARHKKSERDEHGKRIKGPDMRMKTRFGTNRALEKLFKKSEKRATKTNKAYQQSPDVWERKKDNATATQSRPEINMANGATGTSAVDQALMDSYKQEDTRLSNSASEQAAAVKPADHTHADTQHQTLATPSPRSAVSDETLFLKEETDEIRQTLPKVDGANPSKGAIKAVTSSEKNTASGAYVPSSRMIAT